jgi:hypothetical protein
MRRGAVAKVEDATRRGAVRPSGHFLGTGLRAESDLAGPDPCVFLIANKAPPPPPPTPPSPLVLTFCINFFDSTPGLQSQESRGLSRPQRVRSTWGPETRACPKR